MQTEQKRLIRALRGEPMDRPPFWLMRQAGRYLPEYRKIRSQARDFLDLCFTPDKAVEVTLQPLRRYHMDAAILFSDILVVPLALGQNVRFEEGRGPVLDALETPEDIARLNGQRAAEILDPVYQTVDRLTAELPLDTALIGFAGAPWTVATYMVEGGTSRNYERVKGWAYGAPESFDALIGLLVDATADHLIRQIEAGAEVVQIFDTWAGVLAPGAMERFCLNPTVEIASRIHDAHPGVPVIAFPRGVGPGYLSFARTGAFAALSIDTSIDPDWACQKLQPHLAVQGNLDPILLVAGGAAMEDGIRRILGALDNGPYIFNLGHGIVPGTPPEHVARLSEIVRNWPG